MKRAGSAGSVAGSHAFVSMPLTMPTSRLTSQRRNAVERLAALGRQDLARVARAHRRDRVGGGDAALEQAQLIPELDRDGCRTATTAGRARHRVLREDAAVGEVVDRRDDRGPARAPARVDRRGRALPVVDVEHVDAVRRRAIAPCSTAALPSAANRMWLSANSRGAAGPVERARAIVERRAVDEAVARRGRRARAAARREAVRPDARARSACRPRARCRRAASRSATPR